MKTLLAGGVALTLALTQFAAAPAFAEQAFRAPAAQSFSASDLQAYGLDARASARAEALQDQGYQIRVLSTEEAQRYQAGLTNHQWLLLGILGAVVIIAVAS